MYIYAIQEMDSCNLCNEVLKNITLFVLNMSFKPCMNFNTKP